MVPSIAASCRISVNLARTTPQRPNCPKCHHASRHSVGTAEPNGPSWLRGAWVAGWGRWWGSDAATGSPGPRCSSAGVAERPRAVTSRRPTAGTFQLSERSRRMSFPPVILAGPGRAWPRLPSSGLPLTPDVTLATRRNGWQTCRHELQGQRGPGPPPLWALWSSRSKPLRTLRYSRGG